MEDKQDIKIITIKPNKYKNAHHLAVLLAAAISQIKADGLNVRNMRINEDTGTIEIIAQKIREFEIRAIPGIVLAAPQIAPTPRHDTSKILRHYNRMQNIKFNATLRNYKGRKK